MFTVTHIVPESGLVETTDYAQETDSFAVHDSGALVVSRSSEQVIYAPGTWMRVRQSTDTSSESSGNYV